MQPDYRKSAIRLRQICSTTNNITNKETNRETTPLSPMPAGGQASAVLAEREKQMRERIEQLKKSFGFGPRVEQVRMTEQQFQQRKSEMLKALRIGDRRLNIDYGVK